MVTLFNPEAQPGGDGVDAEFESLTFDAVVSISHGGSSTVTRHPVEQGADISDHSRPEPAEIILSEAIISNFPALLGGPLRRPSGSVAAEEGWDKLQRWRREGTPLTLIDELETYENVLLESIQTPRTARTSNSIHTEIRAVQILLATTRVTQAPKSPRTARKLQTGPKAKAAAKAAEEEAASASYKLFGGALKSYLGVP